MKPKVSVIMSVTTVKPRYLKEAVTSILRQTFTRFEFIIVDDAMSLQAKKIVQRFTDSRIRVYHNPRHLGLTRSLNIALNHAHGSYLARMDADDIAHPERIKKQYDYLENHEDVVGCGTWVTLINKQGRKIGVKHYPTQYHHILRTLMRYTPFVHPSVMIRKKIFDQVGNYDTELNGAEDYDLWLRICSRHQMTNLPEELLQYRINSQGVSWSELKKIEWQALRARWKAIKNHEYPLWQSIYLVKPFLSFFIPTDIKKNIFSIE